MNQHPGCCETRKLRNKRREELAKLRFRTQAQQEQSTASDSNKAFTQEFKQAKDESLQLAKAMASLKQAFSSDTDKFTEKQFNDFSQAAVAAGFPIEDIPTMEDLDDYKGGVFGIGREQEKIDNIIKALNERYLSAKDRMSQLLQERRGEGTSAPGPRQDQTMKTTSGGTIRLRNVVPPRRK